MRCQEALDVGRLLREARGRPNLRVETNAQAVTRSAERLQVSAEQASQEIQAAFAQLANRLPSLYTPRD